MARKLRSIIILAILISYVDSSEDLLEKLDSFHETLQNLQKLLQESQNDDRNDNLKLDLKGLINIEHVNFHVNPKHHYDYSRSGDSHAGVFENLCKKIGRCGCGGGRGRCGDNPEELLDSQDLEHLCKKVGRCGCGGGGKRCGDNPEEPLDSQDLEHICKKIGRCGCGGGGRCGDNPEDSQERQDSQESKCKFGRCGCGGGRCGNNLEGEDIDAAICKLTGLRCNARNQRTDDLKGLELVPYRRPDNVKSMNIYFDDNDLRDDDDKSTRFLKEVYLSIREKLKKYVLEKLRNKLKAYLERGSSEVDGFLPSQVSDEDYEARSLYHDALRRVPLMSLPLLAKSNHFPLTKQQKEKLFGSAKRLVQKKDWRRNLGDQLGQGYGVPFELEVQGLGQVNS